MMNLRGVRYTTKNDNVGVRADLKGFKLTQGATHYLGNCHYED